MPVAPNSHVGARKGSFGYRKKKNRTADIAHLDKQGDALQELFCRYPALSGGINTYKMGQSRSGKAVRHYLFSKKPGEENLTALVFGMDKEPLRVRVKLTGPQALLGAFFETIPEQMEKLSQQHHNAFDLTCEFDTINLDVGEDDHILIERIEALKA